MQMEIAANALRPQFIISVGDNFYEHGVASTDDPQWQKTFEDVYVAPSLQVPWYVALGNHDYLGNCDAQIAYSRLSQRWNMPARYFTQTRPIDAATAVDFFYLDTTPMVTRLLARTGLSRACPHAGRSETARLVRGRTGRLDRALENCHRASSDLFRRRPLGTWRHA